MQCDRAQELFSDYIEETMTPAMRQVMDQHLTGCDPCRADVEQLSSVFLALNDGLPMVEVPPGFRANVLNAIRTQPRQETVLSRLRSWLLPAGSDGKRAPAFATAAIVLVLGVGFWIHGHLGVPNSANKPSTVAALAPWGQYAVRVQNQNGILQGVKTYQSADGNTYHVLGLHLTTGTQPVAAEAYLIDSINALKSDTDLANSDNATNVWSGSVEPGMSVQVPVTLTSAVPPGTSMSILVKWTDSVGTHEEICVVPLSAEAPGQSLVVAPGESMFQSLQTIAVAYKTPIIVNENALRSMTTSISRGLDGSDADINDALNDVTSSVSVTFQRQADGSYLIDGQ